MAISILHESWREKNLDRNYPFLDSAMLTNGVDFLPDNFLLDARLYPINGLGQAFLASVERNADTTTFRFSDGSAGEFGTAVMTGSTIPDLIHVTDTYGRSAGVLVPGPGLLEVFNWSNGSHTFETLLQTGFAARTQASLPDPGVNGLLLPDDNVVSGNVWLVGEKGVQLSVENGTVRVDIIGEPLVLVRECNDLGGSLTDVFEARRPLRTINNVAANGQGAFFILVAGTNAPAQTLRITPETNGLRIEGAV